MFLGTLHALWRSKHIHGTHTYTYTHAHYGTNGAVRVVLLCSSVQKPLYIKYNARILPHITCWDGMMEEVGGKLVLVRFVSK